MHWISQTPREQGSSGELTPTLGADRKRPPRDRRVVRLAVCVRRGLERLREEVAQTVAEYALVLLVAAAIAGGFLLWAKSSGRLNGFFDAIFQKLMGSVDATPVPSP